MITATLVKELREKTGAGMMDCKKVLTETDGDMEKAMELLRERGIAKAAKKSDRVAAEGLVECYISEDGKTDKNTDNQGKNSEEGKTDKNPKDKNTDGKQDNNSLTEKNNSNNKDDNDIKIGIERLAIIGTTITADLNVYEYYTSSVNNQYVKDLENAINIGNFDGAKYIVKDSLHGTSKKRQIKFKVNKHGDHFKYTVLSVKNIDY